MRSRTALALLIVGLLAPSVAEAGWQASSNNGRGYSKAASVAAGNQPTAVVSNRSVTVSWSAAGGAVPIDGYIVRRHANGGAEQAIGAACSGTITGLSCTENAVPAGSWRYTVTPVRQNWRGAQSAQSAAVTVLAPTLTVTSSSVTCLPQTLTGQIQNFIGGQTVTFRLDNPTTGLVLTGSIAPTPVPAGGTASTSVTIPATVADGAHTLYAIGSSGDVASTSLSQNTSGMRVATGSYVGNGSDNRNVTGLGFQPDVVIIKGDTSGILPSRVAVIRTSTMAADRTKQLSEPFGDFTNAIQSFSADGFEVGSDGRVNGGGFPNGPTYYWTAFKANAGHMAVGSYTGNGSAGHAITGLGFSPEYALVIANNIAFAEEAPVQRMSAMTRTFPFDTGGGSGISGTGITTGITSLDSGGFTVGTDPSVNRNTTGYQYVAWNECAGETKTASYTGNGGASQTVTGVGFQPDYMIVRANDTAIARQGVHRSASVGGSGSLLFNNAANVTNGITALLSDGFTAGNNAGTNANGVSYPYVAFNDKP